jgi:hypothetical protein
MDRQRLGLWGTFIFAAAAVVGMAVQVYLIAGVLFGEDWLDAHKGLGMLVHLFYILTFVAALVAAWPDWRRTTWPFILAVLGSIQAFLAAAGDIGSGDNAALAAFHGALVPIVFVIALAIAWNAWKLIQSGQSDTYQPPRDRTDVPG